MDQYHTPKAVANRNNYQLLNAVRDLDFILKKDYELPSNVRSEIKALTVSLTKLYNDRKKR